MFMNNPGSLLLVMVTPRSTMAPRSAGGRGRTGSRRRLALLLAALASAPALAGCVTADDSRRALITIGRTEPTPGAHTRPAGPARREVEAKRRAARPAVPPGIEPGILRPRPAADGDATLGLDETLARLARPGGALGDRTDPPRVDRGADAADRDQAFRHYVKGRDAALDNRHRVAVLELRKALKLEPDNVAVLQELARSHLALRDMVSAVTVYERLLKLEPDNSEALLRTGLWAADRRDFLRSVDLLGRKLTGGGSFDHDPAGDALALFELSVALGRLGYDRASIEAGKAALEQIERVPASTFHRRRLGSVYRQRGAVWQAIGDAYCRLEEYEAALAAYRSSAALPTSDPAALPPRLIYANLHLGRGPRAQRELLSALGRDPSSISNRDVRLCIYLAEHLENVDLLAEAMGDLYRRHPQEPSLARAAAALLPPGRALELLRGFIDLRPRDLDVVFELLGWLGERDLTAAAALTVALASDYPELGGDYARRLLVAVPRPATAAVVVSGLDPSPARAQIESHLLVLLGALGEAWEVCRLAQRTWPDDKVLALLRVQLAGELEEPKLLKKALGAARPYDDAWAWLVRARARRLVGQTELAVRAATTAVERAADTAEALIELARAHAAHAMTLDSEPDRNHHADEAVRFAEQAAGMGLDQNEPYEVLVSLYGPRGPLSDPVLLRQAERRLLEANHESRLQALLWAQKALRQQRFEDALERFLSLYDGDPGDTSSLIAAVTAWAGMDRLADAERWLQQRLAERPGSPALLEQWVRVQLMLDRPAVAEKTLDEALEAEPSNHAARHLLETVYRATGQAAAALDLGEKRLLARPQGIHRELELAALYAGGGATDRAIGRLTWLLDHADAATFDQLRAAIRVALRLDDGEDRRAPLVLKLVEHTVERFPDAPLGVYGWGLRAMARMGILDGRFDALLGRAVALARGGSDESPQATLAWRNLAQTLVDVGEPATAGRVLRARMQAEAPLDVRAREFLATVTLASDAAAGGRAEASIELIRDLELHGALGILPREPRADTSLSDALYLASLIYSRIGDDDGVDRLLRETLQLDPDHATALNNIGYMRIEAGRHDDEVIGWIERAFELQPANENVLDTVGWLRYKQSRFEDALGLIQKAVDAVAEPSPEVLSHLGDTYWRLGEREPAVEAWRRVVQIMEDPVYEEEHLLDQRRTWGLRVVDPRQMYDRQHGFVLEHGRRNLRQVEAGDEPAVAPTFAELDETEGLGD